MVYYSVSLRPTMSKEQEVLHHLVLLRPWLCTLETLGPYADVLSQDSPCGVQDMSQTQPPECQVATHASHACSVGQPSWMRYSTHINPGRENGAPHRSCLQDSHDRSGGKKDMHRKEEVTDDTWGLVNAGQC